MATFVLIHGACHGGWCWDNVIELLREKGHTVEAPDLPGHGKDKTPIREATLRSCVDKVCRVLDAQSEPVILVGHSMGGLVISQAAEFRSAKIKTLVYLAAALLQNGESVKSALDGRRYRYMAENQNLSVIKEKLLKATFYGDCPTEDVARARSLTGPEAVAMFITPLELSESKFGTVPRVYIECLRDKALLPSDQKRMYTASPCQKIISMETSHSPFFSAPETLVAHLIAIANF